MVTERRSRFVGDRRRRRMAVAGGPSLAPIAAGVAVACLLVAGFPYLVVATAYAWYRSGGAPVGKRAWGGDEGTLPSVSVVLPTYNEADIVERKLRELADIDYPDDRVEVVVADDSTDETAAVVEAFARNRPIDVTVRRGERAGVAAAVNRAVDAATGTVLFRTDCDAELAPDAIREAVRTLAAPDVGLVTGRQATVLGGSAVEADYRGLLRRVQAVETRIDSTFIVHGPCSALRREDFTPLPTDVIADDTALGVQVRRGGGRVVMDPTVTFAEAGTSGLRARRTRKDRRAVGLLQQLVRNRDLLGRCGRYGRIVLPLNWGLLLVSPWALLIAAVAVTVAAVLAVGVGGLLLPAVAAAVAWLGSREALGPLQPLHAVIDAQASLVVGTVRLLRGPGDGTWTVDRASRDAFD
jgi:cellulose synthase/poly-beta-1,6-N-acetylglucosamine synthase-like glycosyltransferase